MKQAELHELLTSTLKLVPEPRLNNVSRTYFHERIEWHPLRCMRVLRVIFDNMGEPARIQLCASSDNNNTVLIAPPYQGNALSELVAKEIALIEARLSRSATGIATCSTEHPSASSVAAS